MERHVINEEDLKGLEYRNVLASQSAKGYKKSLTLVTVVNSHSFYEVHKDGVFMDWTSVLKSAVQLYNSL